MDKPVIVVGAARSGTTLLGRLLSKHPETTFWNEPKYLWKYRKPGTYHDKRTAVEATANVQNYIRSQLKDRLEQKNAERLVEKTPSNCFRVPFVYEVLPEAHFVHIIRDGRDSAFSAREQWGLVNENIDKSHEEGTTRRLFRYAWRRVQSQDVPIADLPVYAVSFLEKIMNNISSGNSDSKVNVWGPKFPGIREVAETKDALEVCAIQWRESVRSAYEGLQSVPRNQKLEVRFERLLQNPVHETQRILSFAELRRCNKVIQFAEDNFSPDAANRWKNRDSDEVQRVMEEVGGCIEELKSAKKEPNQQ